MALQTIHSDVHVNGQLTATTVTPSDASITNAKVASNAAITRSKLAQDTLSVFPVPLTQLRVHDAVGTLIGTAGNDDLGLTGNTVGTDAIHVTAGDLKAAGATTRYARCLVPLPECYDDGETVQIRVRAFVDTTVADATCTVDVQAYEIDGEGGVGADLCSTSAQDINSLTPANKDFTLTATGLAAGDLLDVRIAIACNDASTGTEVEPIISNIALLCDIKG